MSRTLVGGLVLVALSLAVFAIVRAGLDDRPASAGDRDQASAGRRRAELLDRPPRASRLAEEARRARGEGAAERAASLAERAIDLDPGFVSARVLLASSLREAGRLDAALAAADAALVADRDYAPAYLERALIHELADRPELALDDLAEALAIRPRYEAALRARAALRLKRGETAAAAADLESARSIAAGR